MGVDTSPAVVVAHGGVPDGVSRRIAALAREADWPVYPTSASEFTADAIEAIVRLVGAGDLLLIVHLVAFDDGDVDERRADLVRIEKACSEAYPSVAFKHWGIVLSGRKLDAGELAGLEAIRPELAGVFVTTSSTKESAAHTGVEEACFASDVAVVLGTSSLGSKIESHEGVWMVAVSSVNHAPGITRRITAERWLASTTQRVLDHGDRRTAHELGERWIEEREPGSDEFRAGLQQSPSGTVYGRVRMVFDLDDLTPEEWSQAILTRYDMARVHEMPQVRAQVLANRDEILERQKRAIIDASLAQLGDEGSIETTLGFVEGMRAELGRVVDELRTREPDMVPTTVERDRHRLRQLVRWLPYGPAVAIRLAMMAVVALILAAALIGGGTAPVALLASTVPVSLAAGVLVVGGSAYFWRKHITVRVRNRLVSEVELQLTAEIDHLIWSTHLDLLTELLSFLGSPNAPAPTGDEAESLLAWWAGVRDVVASFDTEDTAIEDGDSTSQSNTVPSSRYAIQAVTVRPGDSSTPVREELDTAMLLRALAEALRTFVPAVALMVPSEAALRNLWLENVAAQVPVADEDLLGALDGRPDRIARAREVVARDLAPSYGEGIEVARYLIVPEQVGEQIEDLLRPGKDVDVSGAFQQLVATLEGSSNNFAAVVHLARRQMSREEPV